MGGTPIADTHVVDQGFVGGDEVVTLLVHHVTQTQAVDAPTQFVVDVGEHDVADERDGRGPSEGVRYVEASIAVGCHHMVQDLSEELHVLAASGCGRRVPQAWPS